MEGWRLIESAPKYPERFVALGYDPKSGWWADHRAMRHHKPLTDKNGKESLILVDGWFSRERQPTHWMPFPERKPDSV